MRRTRDAPAHVLVHHVVKVHPDALVALPSVFKVVARAVALGDGRRAVGGRGRRAGADEGRLRDGRGPEVARGGGELVVLRLLRLLAELVRVRPRGELDGGGGGGGVVAEGGGRLV